VFLLQGQGRRRWQISAQTDLTQLDDVPLKILRHFKAEDEWVLGPGDMLYLPPHVAHYGVAEDACMTYSIGFRAPTVEELTQGFLMHLQDTLTPEGRYADPDLRLQTHPGEISRAMLAQIEGMIARKPNVFFDAPDAPLSLVAFNKLANKTGVALHPKSRLLFAGGRFFINGEAFTPRADETVALQQLADRRRLAPRFPASLCERFYDWYEAGWLELDTE
jgi:50S ribosomal protein L16 3-hydroxylase